MRLQKTNVKWCMLAAFMLVLAPTVSGAMHIMEGFLPVKWAVIWYVLFIPFFVVGLKNITKVVKEHPKKKLLLALCGAFVFVLSALKIPSVTGSCSLPTVVLLSSILFGTSVTVVFVTILFFFQALLLAHGGITTLGANAFSMAIFGPIISYLIWKLCKDKINKNVAVFLAASIGDLATYTLTSLQLGLAFPDPVGGFAVSAIKFLGIFFITQIPIAIAEGLLTTIIYNFITENEDKEVLA